MQHNDQPPTAPAVRPSHSLPDAGCLGAGDEAGERQIRCYAAAGLSDADILRRVLDQFGLTEAAVAEIDFKHDTAAWTVARHLAWAGEPAARIIEILVWLAAEAPAWPDDPDELAYIARAAIRECAP